ncbi:response regulator transcription factor [Ferroacidibacillus organovorans]|uniref:DNA-binding response regulator n=1 Tax=Ferroacidibacillus organovorans TaxID=1765683 RepID=A0A117SYN1_9BACL|nr:response regulator transcription factor [Ferroacidibacillus organovorans]KUO97171.1 hypothetical protein ATW55_12755 [Ferroacidibacillus organovorans]
MKILIVEDDHRIASLLQRGLERKAHVVELAHTVQTGFQAAIDGLFDVLILDIKLPDGDGMSLCEKLRNVGVTIPILMLTARDSTEDKIAGFHHGADDYLTKPFSFEELHVRLIALARRPAVYVENQVLRCGPLELNTGSAEVFKDGVPLELSRKEFSLLELLMRNAGQVMSRQLILEKLWGSDFEPEANVVEAIVARLRAKLDAPKSAPLIRTVRGIGYKIDR